MTERHGPEHSLANAAAQAVCPLAAANAHTTAGQAYATAGQAPAAVEPIAATNALAETDLLTLPMRKRMVAQYITDAGGAKALHLFYDDKEISFDEAELFAFGECLTKQTSFTAGSAVGWGEGYTWPTIRVLLQQLLDEGILQLSAQGAAVAIDSTTAPVANDPPRRDGARPSPLPPAPCATPRSWFDCERITEDLLGHPLELGWLELVVPIFRVAHTAMDTDGRQVGESNVFPKALRVEVLTNWRMCIYSGTRFEVDRPMNVTALKAMRQHWGEMMVVLQCVREAYLRRFPDARNGWTVGHLERLATTVLALPTYQLMHMETANDETRLHPALSSLFRVTDGLRMTMHQMLFVPLGEATLAADAPMTGADILAYAERNYSLHSEHGVCAGPTAMIEEFLSVLVDGRAPRSSAPVELDAEVRQALEALEPAIDYALLGLQAYAVVFSLWPAMTRAYEALADIAERSAAANNPRLLYLRDRMRHHIERIRLGTYLGTEQLRTERELVYADMYAQCGAGLRDQPATRTLKQCIAPARNSRNHAAKHTLLAAARAHFGNAGHTTDTLLVALADCLSQFLLQEQAVLRAATHTQMQINRLLGRAAPKRAFSAADIDMHNLLQGVAERRLPYLINEIEALLGGQIYVDANRIEITGPAASYANETEAANAVA